MCVIGLLQLRVFHPNFSNWRCSSSLPGKCPSGFPTCSLLGMCPFGFPTCSPPGICPLGFPTCSPPSMCPLGFSTCSPPGMYARSVQLARVNWTFYEKKRRVWGIEMMIVGKASFTWSLDLADPDKWHCCQAKQEYLLLKVDFSIWYIGTSSSVCLCLSRHQAGISSCMALIELSHTPSFPYGKGFHMLSNQIFLS